ncbi:MAG: hypothetical protein WA874_09735 [Chryseosolibacter sp.]
MIEMSLKPTAVILVLLLIGCGGNLTDEQRRQMREKMEMNKIIRVTDVEITEAAFSEGRALVNTLDNFQGDSARIDSFLKVKEGRIRFIQPGRSDADALEQQLIDAYLADESGSMQDNVQEKRNAKGEYDSLLYTKPVTKKLADNREQLVGVWNIWLPKKDLILGIGKKK